jgi:hypothetical protein
LSPTSLEQYEGLSIAKKYVLVEMQDNKKRCMKTGTLNKKHWHHAPPGCTENDVTPLPGFWLSDHVK